MQGATGPMGSSQQSIRLYPGSRIDQRRTSTRVVASADRAGPAGIDHARGDPETSRGYFAGKGVLTDEGEGPNPRAHDLEVLEGRRDKRRPEAGETQKGDEAMRKVKGTPKPPTRPQDPERWLRGVLADIRWPAVAVDDPDFEARLRDALRLEPDYLKAVVNFILLAHRKEE